MKYIKTKLKLLKSLGKNRTTFSDYACKLRWFSYINKRRHEDKLLNELENKFGKDVTYVFGDWGNKSSPIKGISMPNMGMRRLLKKRFEVLTVDESYTSKINCFSEEPNENLSLRKKDKSLTLYSVFTFKMSKKMGCINRDLNAVINILKIVKSLVNGNGRPKIFCKALNPNIEVK